MPELTKVTIVIPVRNGRRFLAACLGSLAAQQAEAPELAVSIVVVDNASIDGSAGWVAQHAPHITLIRNQGNLGFAGGCNQGLAAAPADVAILLNQDTQVHPGWLRALVGAFADPTVGVAGCKIYYPDGTTLQHAGAFVQSPQHFGIHHHQHEPDTGQADESRPVEWVTGAAFAIRRAVIDQIGLLDEGFWPGYFEDMDYCLRARAAGFQVWYCAQATLTHQESASSIDHESLQRFYHRGRLRCALKHMAPQAWVDTFMAAERVDPHWQTPARQSAYWDALVAAPVLLREFRQASADEIATVTDALAQLVGGYGHGPTFDETEPAPFTEIVFPASAPVIGPLLSNVRQFWYNVAARWGDRHLQQQQAAANQLLLARIRALQQHIDQLQRQNQLLQRALDQQALHQAALGQQMAQMQQDFNHAITTAAGDGDAQ